MKNIAFAVVLNSAWLFIHDVGAQSYPAQAIRVIVAYRIVAYRPGGANHIVARPMGSRMTDILGQPVIVDIPASALLAAT